MAGEILPDSHVNVLYNLSNYLNELEEVMNSVGEKRPIKSRSPGTVSSSRSRRRQNLQAENKRYRKQRRHSTKSTDKGFSERHNSYPEESRHDDIADKAHNETRNSRTSRHTPCEGGHYFTYASPRYKNPHQKKTKRFIKGNESRMIDDERCSKGSSDIITMRVIQDEMKEMKEKLSAVVETLSSVAEALVKTVTENDGPDANGQSDLEGTEKTVPQLYNEKDVQCDHENEVKSRGRGSDFCCFGLRAVKSSGSDSDYYKPNRSENSRKYDDSKRCGPSSSGDRVLGETTSAESRNSRGCQNITGCYLIQRFLNRVKLLFL